MADMSELREKLRKGLEGAQSGPYKLDARGSYIWAPSEKGGDFPVGDRIGRDDTGIPVMRLRGWGYYTGNGHGALGLSAEEAEAIQRRTGEHLALCSPENIRTLLDELDRVEKERDEARTWRADVEAASRAVMEDEGQAYCYVGIRDYAAVKARAEAAESALEQAVRALTELCDRDNAYLGADILIPCDSHADAIGIMTRARSTLSLLKASRREASS